MKTLNPAVNLTRAVIFLSGAAMISLSAIASDYGSADEAKAMTERAIAELKKDKDATIAQFNEGGNGFKDRDLYVVCWKLDSAGTIIAHGASEKMLGVELATLEDKKGTSFEPLVLVDTNGEMQSYTYWWPRPNESEPSEKETFFITFEDNNCGVGVYKQ